MSSPYDLFLHSEGRLVKALALAGLTRQDLKIYMVLLAQGPLKARQLARESGVPTAKIYSSLSRLESLGLVYRRGKRPYVYVPAPPSEAWFELKRRLLDELERVEQKLIPFLDALSRGSPYYRVTVVGHNEVERVALHVIDSTRGKMLRVAIAFPDLLGERILRALKDASERTRLRLIVSDPAWRQELEDLGAEVKRVRDMFGSGFIGDQVLLVVKMGEWLTGLWSSHEYFSHIATIYFDHLWSNSNS